MEPDYYAVTFETGDRRFGSGCRGIEAVARSRPCRGVSQRTRRYQPSSFYAVWSRDVRWRRVEALRGADSVAWSFCGRLYRRSWQSLNRYSLASSHGSRRSLRNRVCDGPSQRWTYGRRPVWIVAARADVAVLRTGPTSDLFDASDCRRLGCCKTFA
jgi:hypothetical protein